MNTDNMSILGLTIDYGPYGWLEGFDPDWTPNTTDAAGGRYRYGYQPSIAMWNVARFATALLPLIGRAEALESILRTCARDLDERIRRAWAEKLGIAFREGDELVDEMLAVLTLVETDMTIFFRGLADVETSAEALAYDDGRLMAPVMDAYYAPDKLGAYHVSRTGAWLRSYIERVLTESMPLETRRASMNAANPKYVLRNYLAQLAIDKAEQGDGSLVREILDVLRAPYAEQPEKESFAAKRPEWARHRPGCSMLSCSS
jgi:uncharacterized protein YdiU (UPF0061 family)